MEYKRIYEFLGKYLPSFSDYTTRERQNISKSMETLLDRLLIQTRQEADYQDEDLLYFCLPFVHMTAFLEETSIRRFRRILFYPGSFKSAKTQEAVNIEVHEAGLVVVSIEWLKGIISVQELSKLYETWAHILFGESFFTSDQNQLLHHRYIRWRGIVRKLKESSAIAGTEIESILEENPVTIFPKITALFFTRGQQLWQEVPALYYYTFTVFQQDPIHKASDYESLVRKRMAKHSQVGRRLHVRWTILLGVLFLLAVLFVFDYQEDSLFYFIAIAIAVLSLFNVRDLFFYSMDHYELHFSSIFSLMRKSIDPFSVLYIKRVHFGYKMVYEEDGQAKTQSIPSPRTYQEYYGPFFFSVV